MASADDPQPDEPQAGEPQPDKQQPAAPLPCAPCRGSGQVVSNLGGSPSTVTCPWCEGGGVQIPGHDAQAARVAAAG